MEKKNDPRSSGSPIPKIILHPFSNYRELSESEWITLRLAVTTRFRSSEPRSLTKARARIESALLAKSHLLSNDLIPLFDAFEFEAMLLKESIHERRI